MIISVLNWTQMWFFSNWYSEGERLLQRGEQPSTPNPTIPNRQKLKPSTADGQERALVPKSPVGHNRRHHNLPFHQWGIYVSDRRVHRLSTAYYHQLVCCCGRARSRRDSSRQPTLCGHSDGWGRAECINSAFDYVQTCRWRLDDMRVFPIANHRNHEARQCIASSTTASVPSWRTIMHSMTAEAVLVLSDCIKIVRWHAANNVFYISNGVFPCSR